MNAIIFTILLFQCVALPAWGILKTIQLRKKTGEGYFSTSLYFLVFASIFGLYGIWGPGFVRHVILPIDSAEIISKTGRFLLVMGIPFLIAAWIMIARISRELSAKPFKPALAVMLVSLAIALLILSGIFTFPFPENSPVTDSNQVVLASLNALYFFLPGIRLLFLSQDQTPWKVSRPVFWPGFALILCGILQSPAFLFTGITIWIDVAITLSFFIGMLLPFAVLSISPLIRKQPEEESKSDKAFYRKYEISPREAEVLREICLGKSNKEIADTLFISLQTVKDHTHNIFIKTDVRSRIQLVNLFREETPLMK